jgi:hypothetical protein
MSRIVPVAVAIAAFLSFAAPALAASDPVVRDCANDGSVDGHYSQGQYKHALNSIPSDVDEYTDCRSVISQAQAKAAQGDHKSSSGGTSTSGGSGSGGSGSGGATSGAKVRDFDHNGRIDAKDRATAKRLGQGADTTATAAATPASAPSNGDDGGGFPTGLLILLVVLGIGGAAAAYLALRDRVNARRQT